MRVERVLTWVSRVLFAVGLVLFAGLFVYLIARSGSGEGTTSGGTVTNVSSGEMRVAVIIFAAIAWSFLAGSALRTLSQSMSWPRALLSIAELVGFGVVFAAPIYAVSGRDGMAGALACFLSGFAVIIASKVVAFVAFGAKDALARVERGIAGFNSVVASHETPPTVGGSAPYAPSGMSFVPEPPAQEPPPSAR